MYLRGHFFIRMQPFFFVLKHFARQSIDSNFLRDRTMFDVEGISQTTPAFFFFQFFTDDFSRMSLKSYRPRSLDADLCLFRKFLARVSRRWRYCRKKPNGCYAGETKLHCLRHTNPG